ncbi:MAG: hypothetical protein J6R17_07085 [Bacteroidales bacterium]|nr:hypothetical protein [Bacteroidales bacterium]
MKSLLKILPLLFLLTVSCARRDEALRLLEKAQSLIESAPDSALMYLDSIFLPEKFLSKENYMEYLVTNVQAKYKNFKDVKDDTLIFEAKRYFIGKAHDPKLIAYSYLYSGCVYDERQDYGKALNEYNYAFSTAELSHDSILMYLSTSYIANIYGKQNYFDKALEKHLQSINYIKEGDKEMLATSYANIAKGYLISLNNDNSIYYIDKALDIVTDSDNKKLLSSVYQFAHVIYRECNRIEEAKDFLRLSIEANGDSLATSLYNLNLAELYLETGEQDSTKKYTHKLINEIDNINDMAFLASSYSFISDYYSSLNMNDSALYYQDRLTRTIDKIREDNMKQNIYEVEKKYDYERLSNNYHKKLNRQFKMIIVMLLILIILVTIISMLIVRKKKGEIALMKKNEQLVIEMNSLKSEYNILEELNNDIKSSVGNILKQRSKLIVKVNNIEKKHNDTDKDIVNELKSLVYGSRNKSGLIAAIDLLENTYEKLPTFVKERYSNLNETEYNVCILSMLPLSSREIAGIINLGESSVAKARTNIRKKIGAEGYGSDISDFIFEEFYSRKH